MARCFRRHPIRMSHELLRPNPGIPWKSGIVVSWRTTHDSFKLNSSWHAALYVKCVVFFFFAIFMYSFQLVYLINLDTLMKTPTELRQLC